MTLTSVLVWALLAMIALGACWKTGAFRRSSYLGNREPRLPASVWLVFALATYLAQGLGAVAAVGAGASSELMTLALATIGGACGAIAVAAGGYFLPEEFRLRPDSGVRASGRDLWAGTLAVLVALPLVSVAAMLGRFVSIEVFDIEPDRLAHDTLVKLAENESSAVFWMTALAVVVGAPIAEEILFRGFLQTALRRVGLSPLLAVVGASFAFLAVHPSVLDASAMPALFILSLVFGLSFEKTGRLGTPIVAHALFNALNLWWASASNV